MNRATIFLLIIAVAFLYQVPAFASTDNEFVNWNYIDFMIPLKRINPKLFLRETVSPRLKNELSDMDVTLLRSELGYKLSESFTTSVGYDWLRRFNAEGRYENRIWQQILISKEINKSKLYSRLRLEERMVEDRDTTVRLRTRFGYNHPLTETISLDISDEIFINLNNSSGIEQNRILLCLDKQINKNLKLSLGYQLQHFFLDRNLINHALVTRFQFRF